MAHTHSTQKPHAPATGATEPDAIDIRSIFGFGIGLTVVVVFSHLAMVLMFRVLENQKAAAEPPPRYPMAVSQDLRMPPEPRLQGGVHTDNTGRLLFEPLEHNPGSREALAELHAEEEAILDGYSWVDRNNKVVRIPIDTAMKLTLQRGLPARNVAPAPAQDTQADRKDQGK